MFPSFYRYFTNQSIIYYTSALATHIEYYNGKDTYVRIYKHVILTMDKVIWSYFVFLNTPSFTSNHSSFYTYTTTTIVYLLRPYLYNFLLIYLVLTRLTKRVCLFVLYVRLTYMNVLVVVVTIIMCSRFHSNFLHK